MCVFVCVVMVMNTGKITGGEGAKEKVEECLCVCVDH